MPRTFGQVAGRIHWPFDAFRRARVEELRRAVSAGYYRIAADRIAESIVGKLALRRIRVSDVRRRVIAGDYAVDLKRSYERELRRSQELEEASAATVRALAMVAERDDETGNHIQRVHDVGLLLAREVIPEEAEDRELAYGL